jgi:hypothetical protein
LYENKKYNYDFVLTLISFVTKVKITPNVIPRLDIFPITPAMMGLLKYAIETVKMTIAINSIPNIKPTIPIILSKLSMNMIHLSKEFIELELLYGLPFIKTTIKKQKY